MTMHPYYSGGDFDRLMVFPAFAGGLTVLISLMGLVYDRFARGVWDLSWLKLTMGGLGLLAFGVFLVWVTKPTMRARPPCRATDRRPAVNTRPN